MLQIKKSLSGPILFNWFVLAKGMFLVAKNAKRLKQYPSSIFSIFVTPVSLHLGSFESQSFVTLGHRCGSTGKGGERYKTSAPQHGIRLASLLPQEAPLIRWPPSPHISTSPNFQIISRSPVSPVRENARPYQEVNRSGPRWYPHRNYSVVIDVISQTPRRGWKWSRT